MATRWPQRKLRKTETRYPERSPCDPRKHASNHRGRNLTQRHLKSCSPAAGGAHGPALLASHPGPGLLARRLRRLPGSSRECWQPPGLLRSSGRVCQCLRRSTCAGEPSGRGAPPHSRQSSARARRQTGGHPAVLQRYSASAMGPMPLCLLCTRIRTMQLVDVSYLY